MGLRQGPLGHSQLRAEGNTLRRPGVSKSRLQLRGMRRIGVWMYATRLAKTDGNSMESEAAKKLHPQV